MKYTKLGNSDLTVWQLRSDGVQDLYGMYGLWRRQKRTAQLDHRRGTFPGDH